MTTFRKDFSVATADPKEVSFSLSGEEFECVPDVSIGAMETYRAGFVPDEDDPTKVGIPLEVCTKFIEDCLAPSAAIDPEGHLTVVKRFRAVCEPLPLNTGSETLHEIRAFLVATAAGVGEVDGDPKGPTTEPQGSLNGQSPSGPISLENSGSPE